MIYGNVYRRLWLDRVPNAYGMTQFADGGSMITKPYISGSNYLLNGRMEKGPWQATWDGLLWCFMHVHRELFTKNQRLNIPVATFDKMPENKRWFALKMRRCFWRSWIMAKVSYLQRKKKNNKICNRVYVFLNIELYHFYTLNPLLSRSLFCFYHTALTHQQYILLHRLYSSNLIFLLAEKAYLS